jgi:bifunctional non-homologous end joining protein LigD
MGVEAMAWAMTKDQCVKSSSSPEWQRRLRAVVVSKDDAPELVSVDGHEVRITHPQKSYFSKQAKLSKLDIVTYYQPVAQGALAGLRDRPMVLKRFVDGAEGEAFYQKRAPADRPSWLRTVTLSFPSGRTAEEVVIDNAAGLLWAVNRAASNCIRTRFDQVT